MSKAPDANDVRAEYTLLDLWRVVWRDRWLVLLITVGITLAATTYSLMATQWYRAHAVLMFADEGLQPGLGRQLGGLAALAGLNDLGGGSSRGEALAVLRSRDFAGEFIRANDLLTTFAKFPEGASVEALETESISSIDIRDAVRFFHENVLGIQEDRNTGQITLSIYWTDPNIASIWAAELISQINGRMRDRALREAEANVSFLTQELSENSIVTLQQSIGNLLQNELQKLMLARGNDEFAFRVIDPPEPPDKRARPRRTLIVVTAFLLAGMLSLFVVFVRHALRDSTR